VPIGLSDPDGSQCGQVNDLNIAMRRAVVNALDFSRTTWAWTGRSRTPTCPRRQTSISQAVDRTVGVHDVIAKAHLDD
jgi:DNA-binding protein H-NS